MPEGTLMSRLYRSSIMAPRAYWKGFLRLSLVSCPIALYPATSEPEKIAFHQITRNTGNRIQYRKVDSDTGREVDKRHVRFAPESGYVQCTSSCLLWANSGHSGGASGRF